MQGVQSEDKISTEKWNVVIIVSGDRDKNLKEKPNGKWNKGSCECGTKPHPVKNIQLGKIKWKFLRSK